MRMKRTTIKPESIVELCLARVSPLWQRWYGESDRMRVQGVLVTLPAPLNIGGWRNDRRWKSARKTGKRHSNYKREDVGIEGLNPSPPILTLERRNSMDQILTKIEAVIEKFIADLEREPVKTSIKLLILYWIVKTVYRDIKGRWDMRRLIDLGTVIAILWAVSYFILEPVKMTINQGGQVTAIICCTIAFCAIVIPFIVKCGGKEG